MTDAYHNDGVGPCRVRQGHTASQGSNSCKDLLGVDDGGQVVTLACCRDCSSMQRGSNKQTGGGPADNVLLWEELHDDDWLVMKEKWMASKAGDGPLVLGASEATGCGGGVWKERVEDCCRPASSSPVLAINSSSLANTAEAGAMGVRADSVKRLRGLEQEQKVSI
jgi:hypothetical protein